MEFDRKIIDYFILSVLVNILISSCSMKQKSDDFINKKGIKTIGTVCRSYTKYNEHRKERLYIVEFDFNKVDSRILNQHYEITEEDYCEVIEGMKYEVRYLEKRPEINSIILVNKPIESEYININKEIHRISNKYSPLPSKYYDNVCFERGDILYHYSYISKVPFANRISLRHDSLVLSVPSGYYKYDSDSVGIHYLCNQESGKIMDTLKSFDLNKQEIDVFESFYQGKADTFKIRNRDILVFKHKVIENYNGFKIFLEHWDPEWRCPGEERISIYKDTINIKNFALSRGVADYVLVNKDLLILTSYSENGRHLQSIPLDSLIQGL